MSELTATQCGCTNSCQNSSGCCSWIWIIIILFLLGGSCGNDCGNGCGGNGGLFNLFGNGGCGNDCGNNSCEWIIILVLLFSCCGCNN